MLQIVPGCSVKRRKSTPKRDWTSSGTTHHARHERRSPAPSASRSPTASRHARPPRPALVERQQQRPDEHPRRHRRVHAPAGGGHDQRERRRPHPPAAEPARDAHQQPRQRGVAEQRDRRAAGEDDDVRVEQSTSRPGDGVRRRPRRPASSSISRTAPQAASARISAEPQPLHEPRREPERVAEREERPHREQVAAVLAALHVAEVAGRRPRARDVAQETGGIDVQVDLRVRGRQPGPLREREARTRAARAPGRGVGRAFARRRGYGPALDAPLRSPPSPCCAPAGAVAFGRGGYFDAARLRAGIAACLLAALAAAVAPRRCRAARPARVALGGHGGADGLVRALADVGAAGRPGASTTSSATCSTSRRWSPRRRC